jgi:hypothetical protein
MCKKTKIKQTLVLGRSCSSRMRRRITGALCATFRHTVLTDVSTHEGILTVTLQSLNTREVTVTPNTAPDISFSLRARGAHKSSHFPFKDGQYCACQCVGTEETHRTFIRCALNTFSSRLLSCESCPPAEGRLDPGGHVRCVTDTVTLAQVYLRLHPPVYPCQFIPPLLQISPLYNSRQVTQTASGF